MEKNTRENSIVFEFSLVFSLVKCKKNNKFMIIFREIPTFSFVIALAIMIIGTYLAFTEEHNHRHSHLVMTHEHSHSRDKTIIGKHNHVHTHDEYTHSHKHTQDIHYSHAH